ncbi:MAG: hypothetical protein AAGK97_06415 [Bacteroidota bacterium]
MNKRTFVLFLLLGIPILIFGNIKPLDRLKQQLKNSNPDSSRVIILNKISWELHRINPDTSKVYAEQAQKLAINR